jgi:FAD/FMN-containing dehydrogenase
MDTVMNTTQADAIPIATREGGRTSLTAKQTSTLHSRFDGRLLRPGDVGWNESIQIWNGMVAKTPALILQPTNAQEVADAVRFARDKELLLSIKGGGHNIAGTSVADNGLMIHMGRMRSVVVDQERRLVHVGPGCLLQDVDRETQKYGLATVLGFVSETGVAGLTLGGGFGYLTRRFGWTVDNLEEVEIVAADGTIRVANHTDHPDLFWAVRGGGGNFGVVTRFTFRLHSVGPTVFGGLIAWPFALADDVLDAYRRLTDTAPRELATWLVLRRAPPAPFVPIEWHGKQICGMALCYSGDLRKVEDSIEPIRKLPQPIVNLLREQPYVQLQSYLDATQPKGMHYYWKTEFLPRISRDFLKTIRELSDDCSIPKAQIGVLHLGGALNERSPDDGAVGNRDLQFACGIMGMWDPGEPKATEFQQWVRRGWERIRPFSTGATYINFQTFDEDPQRIRATYAANYARLVEIKKKYDPENMFRMNRNIRPTDEE